MIITEGIAISPEARGTIGIPKLYTEQQTEAWKEVTEQVHQEGGIIIAQLWHVGRLSHSSITGGIQPIAPSAVQANGLTHRALAKHELTLHALVRKYWDGVVIGVGELTPEIAEGSLANGEIQLAAFGRSLLSNVDFVRRIKDKKAIKDYNSKVDLQYLK